MPSSGHRKTTLWAVLPPPLVYIVAPYQVMVQSGKDAQGQSFENATLWALLPPPLLVYIVGLPTVAKWERCPGVELGAIASLFRCRLFFLIFSMKLWFLFIFFLKYLKKLFILIFSLSYLKKIEDLSIQISGPHLQQASGLMDSLENHYTAYWLRIIQRN